MQNIWVFFCNDRAKKNKSVNGDSIQHGTIGQKFVIKFCHRVQKVSFFLIFFLILKNELRNFHTKFSLDLKQHLCNTCCSDKSFDEEKKTFKKLYCFILFKLDSKVHIIGFLSINETAWRWFLTFMTVTSRFFP